VRTDQVDELDIRLIRELAAHPRASHLELARRIGVTRATVHARLAKLTQRGVIIGFGQGRLDEVAGVLRSVPQVLEAHGITGAGDVHCRVVARTHEQLQDILIQLNRSSSVVRSNSVISLSELVPYRTLSLLEEPPVS
jgi:DNA-binding Lrp family transcriptional regulator